MSQKQNHEPTETEHCIDCPGIGFECLSGHIMTEPIMRFDDFALGRARHKYWQKMIGRKIILSSETETR